jgi:hypothetical protein
MGSKSDFLHCQGIIADVDKYLEKATYESAAYWMGECRRLAVALADTTGYKTFTRIPTPTELKEES